MASKADEIRARIETLQSRTDVLASDKQLTVESLQSALSRLESADAARKLAADYAESLKQAPERIAALQEELARPISPAVSTETLGPDPATAQLRMAALQVKVVSLRTKQREIDDALRSMTSRQSGGRQQLSDLREQLEQRADTLPSDASQLLIDASQIKDDAVRQDLSARIEKTEQELLSLPTRQAIAAAEQAVIARDTNQAMAAISDLGRRMDAREQEDVRNKLERAHQLVRDTQDHAAPLQALAKQTLELRESLFAIANEMRKLWSIKDRLHSQIEDVANARKNAEQILAFGWIGEEYGRLLRDTAKKLPAEAALDHRIAERHDAIVGVRVDRFRGEKQLAEANAGTFALDQLMQSLGTAPSPETHARAQSLLDDRRAALVDLNAMQGRELGALEELDQLETELRQRSAQLRSMLDQRLLWLPSSTPVNLAWGGQVLSGFASLFSASNLSSLLPVATMSLASKSLPVVLSTIAMLGLITFRKRLRARFNILAAPVGTRADRFALTLQAVLVTILLTLPAPALAVMLGYLFVEPYSPASFPSAVGRGFINVGIVLFILGLFRNMCRHDGLFAGHFRWNPAGVKRLGQALWMVSLALVPAVWFSSVARTIDDPLVADGVGRLGLLAISVSLAIFTHRVFRPKGGAMTGSLSAKGLLWRTRHVWYAVLVATPLVLAAIAMAGYSASADELQARMIVSGWVLLTTVIVFHIVVRGVQVAGRQAAYRQAETRKARQLDEARAGAGAESIGEGAPVLHDDPDIDVLSVSQQTRGLLAAAALILLVSMLWSIWSDLVPALGIFNDIVLWSSFRTTAAGQVVSAITLGHVLLSVVLLSLTFFAARNLPGFLEVVALHRFNIDSGTRYAYVTIIRYGILAIGLLFAFSHIGADWSKLQWIIAALGVGLGFGLQEIVANFVSGIIILFERPVRVGDLITIDGTMGTVSRIKIRAITITDPDNFEVLVPNKAFITGTVKNWSLTSPMTRLVIKVGIGYGSDVAKAQQLMLDIAKADSHVLESPSPVALFLGFGDSALELELRVFVDRIDQRLPTLNNLHMAILESFKDAGIEIPFPQRDVHLHGLVAECVDKGKGDTIDAAGELPIQQDP